MLYPRARFRTTHGGGIERAGRMAITGIVLAEFGKW
jgi:hypothetical protein